MTINKDGGVTQALNLMAWRKAVLDEVQALVEREGDGGRVHRINQRNMAIFDIPNGCAEKIGQMLDVERERRAQDD